MPPMSSNIIFSKTKGTVCNARKLPLRQEVSTLSSNADTLHMHSEWSIVVSSVDSYLIRETRATGLRANVLWNQVYTNRCAKRP
jgi:hypothetical protein